MLGVLTLEDGKPSLLQLIFFVARSLQYSNAFKVSFKKNNFLEVCQHDYRITGGVFPNEYNVTIGGRSLWTPKNDYLIYGWPLFDLHLGYKYMIVC